MPYQSCQKLAVSHSRPKRNEVSARGRDGRVVLPILHLLLDLRERLDQPLRVRLHLVDLRLEFRIRHLRGPGERRLELGGKLLVGLPVGWQRALQDGCLGREIHRRDLDLVRRLLLARAAQHRLLLRQVVVDLVLLLDRRSRVREIREHSPHVFRRIAKGAGKGIKRRQRRVRLLRGLARRGQLLELRQARFAERAGEGGVLVHFMADEIHVFQTGQTIEPQIAQVLAKEARPLAEKENRDQRQHHHRHHGIAVEEVLDHIARRQPQEAELVAIEQRLADGRRHAWMR